MTALIPPNRQTADIQAEADQLSLSAIAAG